MRLTESTLPARAGEGMSHRTAYHAGAGLNHQQVWSRRRGVGTSLRCIGGLQSNKDDHEREGDKNGTFLSLMTACNKIDGKY